MKTVILMIALLIGINANAAFIKTTTTPQGDSANYWTEQKSTLDKQNLTIQCTLALYLSSSAYAAHDSSFKVKYLPPMKIQESDLSNSDTAICESYILVNYVNAGTPKDSFLVGATQQ